MANIRMTPEQYRAAVAGHQPKLVFGQKPPAVAAPKARAQQKREDLPENQVEAQILGFLRVHGWTIQRNQVGTYVPYWAAMKIQEGQPLNHSNVVKIGEKGQPDYTATRARRDDPNRPELFHLEIKAPGKKPNPEQLEWMRKRAAIGYVVAWFSDFEKFRSWYLQYWKS